MTPGRRSAGLPAALDRLVCLLMVVVPGLAHGQPTWVEDFKNPVGGFDRRWKVVKPAGSTTQVEFESTGETARLCVRGSPNAYASVVTSDWIDWDTRSNRWLQIQVPNLEFGERTKVLVHSSMGAGGWALLHDEWGAIPGQGPQPQTMDVNAAIPAGSQQILLMFEIVDNVWGDPPEGAEVNLDWIKAGMPGHSILPADAPKPTMPIEGETVGNLPMLGWSAPAGYGANRYSVSLSRDPLFSDASTLTALDSVFGTRFQVRTKLSPGRWYWKVSATGAEGLSGPFSALTGDPAFDPRDPRSRRHSSFVVSEALTAAGAVRPFSNRMGSQGFRAEYRFSGDPVLVEQARRCLELGSQSYKFLLGWDQYRTVYPDLAELPPSARRSIVELVQNEPAYKRIFEMPFQFYSMWTYAMGVPYWHFGNGLSAEHAQEEYRQIYDLTRLLMQRYQNTGKTFLIGHWEGDWVLLEGYDYHGVPRETMIQGMIDWYRLRQRAVEDARRSLPDIQGVLVIHYAEVNLIEKAMEGKATVASRVLPHVAVDAVSYSAYDATNFRFELPHRLHQHLDYLWWNSRFTGAWPHGRPVFIGEFGFGGADPIVAGLTDQAAAQAAHTWGCPLIQFWSVYPSSPDSRSSLIDRDAQPTGSHEVLRRFIVGSSNLRGASLAWLGRDPFEEEHNGFGALAGLHLGSEALRFVLDSARFRAATTHRDFVETVIRRATGVVDSGSPAALQWVASLESGQLTRFQCLLQILDSAAFHPAVSEAEFSRYLNGLRSGAWDLPSPLPPVPRSTLYLQALDSESFTQQGLAIGATGTLPEVDALRWGVNVARMPIVLTWKSGAPGIVLQLFGHTGANYRIESSPDLRKWGAFSTVVMVDGAASVVVGQGTDGERFFRVVAE